MILLPSASSRCTHQQESGDVFHPCCEVLLKCVRVFVAEEFDSCLSLQRADDSRAHKRRTARIRAANPFVSRANVRFLFLCVRGSLPRCLSYTRSIRTTDEACGGFVFILGHSARVVVVSYCIISLSIERVETRGPSLVHCRTALVEVVVRRRASRASAHPRRTDGGQAGRARWRVGFTARCTANRW